MTASTLKREADACKLPLLKRLEFMAKAGLYEIEVDKISEAEMDELVKRNFEVLPWEGWGANYLIRWNRNDSR